jgi:membrane fusion protein (multidrug efflux system)
MGSSASPEHPNHEGAETIKEAVDEKQNRDASGRESPQSPNGDQQAQQPHKIPFYRRPLLMAVLIIIGLIIAGGVTAYWLYARQFEETDDAFIDGHVVQIAPKVAGYVVKLNINDNQMVKRGDLLLEIDPRDYQLAVDQALAAVAAAQGRSQQAQAQVNFAEAQAKAADAELDAAAASAKNAASLLKREQGLVPAAVSGQEFDTAKANATATAAQEAAARSRKAAAQRQVAEARSQLVTAKNDVRQSQVDLDRARLNLSYTKIEAPITGRVTHRTVELGNYLTPGEALFALIDPHVWVTANFKETQLTYMQVGQPVEVNIDAYPGQRLRAHIDSFQAGSGMAFSVLPPENATGNYVKVVQRVPVKIVFDEPIPADMDLGPGMSVEPTVRIR